MAFTIIDHSPRSSEIRNILSNLTPYQSMLLFDWPPRSLTPQGPALLGWIQREVEAGGEQDFYSDSHSIAEYRGYIALDTAVELVRDLEPNYILYGESS